MDCQDNKSPISFSITLGLTLLALSVGALLFESYATSPGPKSTSETTTATGEKTTPSEPEKTEKVATENGKAAAPGSDDADAARLLSRARKHIQTLEDDLQPLRSIASWLE